MCLLDQASMPRALSRHPSPPNLQPLPRGSPLLHPRASQGAESVSCQGGVGTSLCHPPRLFHLPVHSGIGSAVLCLAFIGGHRADIADCRAHSTCHHPGSRVPWPLSSFCTFPSPAWSPCLGLVPPCPFAISSFLRKPGLSMTWEAIWSSLIIFSLTY